MKVRNETRDKIHVITLGCSKNLVDSENLITQLRANDFAVTHETGGSQAGTVIVNTCGFIDLAKQESINTILEYARHKERGRIRKLIVTGCLSQRYRDELSVEIPEVDAWYGTMELPLLLAGLNADYKHELIGEKLTLTPDHYAYVKIAEGCNRTCSFCAIPLMRGQHVSRPVEEIVREARHLAARGVVEIMLISQELTYYGLDLYKKRALPELLKALCTVEGIEWIRLHYAYPAKFPMEILDVMADEPKICKYLDMPLQHISDPMLLAMRRQLTNRETRELIEAIRNRLPGIALRTTLITGFPGESEKDFQELCAFVREYRFDRMGVFQYSHEENTSAYQLEDDVPESVKQERMETLMQIQSQISLEQNRTLVGTTRRVLVDRKQDGFYIGRTEADSPEVDNEVWLDAAKQYARVGGFVQARITDATEFDLYAEIV